MTLELILGVFGMAIPYLSKLLIDEVYPNHNVRMMHVLVGGILGITVSQAVLGAVRAYYTACTTSALTSATSLLFFNHLQHLRVRFYDEHRVGEIMSRFTDVRNSMTTVSRLFETVFVNVPYLILVPPFLFLLQWKLAIFSIVTLPLTVGIATASIRMMRKLLKRSAEASAELNAYQVEVLSHIRTLKSLSAENHVYERANRQTQEALRLQLRAGLIRQGFIALNATVRALGAAFFTWYGWTLIINAEMSLGDFIAFTAYVGYLANPLHQVTGLFSDFQQTAVSLGRMFEYLDDPVEQDPSAAYRRPAAIARPLRGDIELEGVSFGYSPDKRILHDLTLRFPHGRVTAVVGPSGAGKSSLLRLITRMEEPDGGEVRIDGIPIREMPVADLRRQVSVVWQEFSLMQGTIWDNLTLGAPDAPRARVDDAVRLCRLEPLIAELPRGYETSVSEWGASLSGGQRQRMALARALIRDTPILLLDEATANVDMQTETEILRDLFARLEDRTVVYVTHRVPTAALADQVCVIQAGRVHAVGTHAELLLEDELYQNLHEGGAVEETRRRRVLVPT